jgi:dipeptidyl aminopeptidase/acylaminoacyl peptidase
MLQRLQLSFPGELVAPVSASTDGSKLVLYVYSDRDPGAYYLFDTKTVKASLIGGLFDRIDPEEMGERRPITFKARDGKTLHGYLTIPPARAAKSLPMIVLPHGGPIGIADTWRWDADAQLLATHGYGVLQINFRGSGGYGSDFEEAGHQAWDSVMIDDITDGTRWAIAQGIADGKRVCIYGASYGGYAALMSAEREPDLYRCTVGYAGVYDLKLLRSESDATESRQGRKAFDVFVGASPERLQKASPITYVDRLKAAVMIVHGTEDQRAPFTQAKALRKALDARHYPYEWLEKSGEGHGFYNPENRAEFYTRLLAFLDKNIGPAPIEPAAATASTEASAVPAGAPPEGPARN